MAISVRIKKFLKTAGSIIKFLLEVIMFPLFFILATVISSPKLILIFIVSCVVMTLSYLFLPAVFYLLLAVMFFIYFSIGFLVIREYNSQADEKEPEPKVFLSKEERLAREMEEKLFGKSYVE